jgi:hypothetical protein
VESTFFQNYVLSGGWAMVLLVPASVVALATALQAALAHKRRRETPDLADVSVFVRPLLWVYAAAPIIGALGSVTKLWRQAAAHGSGEDALLPLMWGLGIGLFAISAAMLVSRGRSGGRRFSVLLILPGFIALAAAAVLCGVAARGAAGGASRSAPMLAMKSLSQVATDDGKSPVLRVTENGYDIDGNAVTDGDIVFRLAGLAARSEVIIVECARGLPAQQLADALALVNQAGFLQVGVETTE